jgi:hypothetical protein
MRLPNYDLCQRALAAFLAISARFFEVRAFALAGPPLSPPRRPKATAAGFFLGVSSPALVTASITDLAISLKSLLVRLGIRKLYHESAQCPEFQNSK